MSFCAYVKSELIDFADSDKCQNCHKAVLAGIIRSYGGLVFLPESETVKVSLNHIDASQAGFYKRLFKEEYPDIKVAVKAMQHKTAHGGSSNLQNMVIYIPMSGELFDDLCLTVIGGEVYYERYYKRPIRSCCIKSYLSGCFFAAGSVNDPEKSYHLSIYFMDGMVCEEAAEMMQRFDLHAKIGEKGERSYIYFKDSQEISDVLKIFGAGMAVLKLENTIVTRDVINRANRVVNCDSANLDRTVKAGIQQAEKIKGLMESGAFDGLPENLKTIGFLRVQNPNISLGELGELTNPPISKSGANHRMRKLMKIADEQAGNGHAGDDEDGR